MHAPVQSAVAHLPKTQEHANQGHPPWRPLVSAVSQVFVSSKGLSLPAFRKVLLRAVPAAVAGLIQQGRLYAVTRDQILGLHEHPRAWAEPEKLCGICCLL